MADESPGARPPRRRMRAERLPRGPLSLLADHVRRLAGEVRSQQTTGDHLSALEQRRNQFDGIASRAEGLVEIARALRTAQAAVPPLPALRASLQAASEVRQRYAADPQAVRGASARSIDSPLQPAEEAFRHAWGQVASPDPGAVALAELLSRFPQFAAARADIQQFCLRLAQAARTLPRSADDVAVVLQLKKQLHDRIEALEHEGVDADVQRFLREAVTGVSLDRLLERPAIVEFLRANQLLSSLMVSFRPRTAR